MILMPVKYEYPVYWSNRNIVYKCVCTGGRRDGAVRCPPAISCQYPAG